MLGGWQSVDKAGRRLAPKQPSGESPTAPKRVRDYNHPYYWASFIQSGEWANLAGKR
jgi:CHAT domain-containing protein